VPFIDEAQFLQNAPVNNGKGSERRKSECRKSKKNVKSLKVDRKFEKDQNVENEEVDQNVKNQNLESQK
jgi:hypothetical protein